MDRRAGACGASFLPSWPSFQGLSSAFRTDSLVLPICDPLTGIIDAQTRLASAKPRVVIKHRGAKSPKSTRKRAAQKQARAAATKQKGRADCCRQDVRRFPFHRYGKVLQFRLPGWRITGTPRSHSEILAPGASRLSRSPTRFEPAG